MAAMQPALDRRALTPPASPSGVLIVPPVGRRGGVLHDRRLAADDAGADGAAGAAGGVRRRGAGAGGGGGLRGRRAELGGVARRAGLAALPLPDTRCRAVLVRAARRPGGPARPRGA